MNNANWIAARARSLVESRSIKSYLSDLLSAV